MGTVLIRLHPWGVRALLKDEAIGERLHEVGEKIANRAGDGFVCNPVETHGNRARVSVVAVTAKAKQAESEQHVLLAAIDAGRS